MKPRALLERFRGWPSQPALAGAMPGDGQAITYAGLLAKIELWRTVLADGGILPQELFGIASDLSPDALALLIAGMDLGAAPVLLPVDSPENDSLLAEVAAVGCFRADADKALSWEPRQRLDEDRHPLLNQLSAGDGGFVIFTSGSTGRPKAVLHRASRFLSKFEHEGRALRTLAFLLFDHIAGIDTIFYTLAAGGTLVVPDQRDPDAVGALVASERAEVLPTSPTFLKLLCLSDALEKHDWSSLRVVAYGSERMSEGTLSRVREELPNASLMQRYGTSELGSPGTKSRDDGSTWLSLRRHGVENEVREGILWVRSESSMLGYLNAPDPFDEDGWYCTGDRVVVDGDWIRFVGRDSQQIQVGGEKVAPEEVVDVLLELPWVTAARVDGMDHALMGQVVRARLELAEGAPEGPALRRRVRAHCRERLAPYKVPVKLEIASEALDPKARRLGATYRAD